MVINSKRFVFALCFILTAFIIILSCEKKGSYGPASAVSGGVTGHVYLSGSLKPLANVIVSCGQAVDTTGKSGRYTLGNIPTGSQDISASNSYYQAYNSKVNIRSNEITNLDIFMSYNK
jgi:hypothetical protein